jgi:hypothetical protein
MVRSLVFLRTRPLLPQCIGDPGSQIHSQKHLTQRIGGEESAVLKLPHRAQVAEGRRVGGIEIQGGERGGGVGGPFGRAATIPRAAGRQENTEGKGQEGC